VHASFSEVNEPQTIRKSVLHDACTTLGALNGRPAQDGLGRAFERPARNGVNTPLAALAANDTLTLRAIQMSLAPSISDAQLSQENPQLSSRECRIIDAEKIRQDFVRSKKLPRLSSSISSPLTGLSWNNFRDYLSALHESVSLQEGRANQSSGKRGVFRPLQRKDVPSAWLLARRKSHHEVSTSVVSLK